MFFSVILCFFKITNDGFLWLIYDVLSYMFLYSMKKNSIFLSS
ncbi:unnamed protein product [Brassica oleracea var. botrytis]